MISNQSGLVARAAQATLPVHRAETPSSTEPSACGLHEPSRSRLPLFADRTDECPAAVGAEFELLSAADNAAGATAKV